MGDSIQVSGENTSEEVEFFLINTGEDMLLGQGSDHIDREQEASNITLSKQICDKDPCPKVLAHEEVKDHWGMLCLRSWIVEEGEERFYQEGLLEQMLLPSELLAKFFD